MEPIEHESGKKPGIGAGPSLLFIAIVLVCVNTLQKRAWHSSLRFPISPRSSQQSELTGLEKAGWG